MYFNNITNIVESFKDRNLHMYNHEVYGSLVN
jgi:hypothetical protein